MIPSRWNSPVNTKERQNAVNKEIKGYKTVYHKNVKIMVIIFKGFMFLVIKCFHDYKFSLWTELSVRVKLLIKLIRYIILYWSPAGNVYFITQVKGERIQ